MRGLALLSCCSVLALSSSGARADEPPEEPAGIVLEAQVRSAAMAHGGESARIDGVTLVVQIDDGAEHTVALRELERLVRYDDAEPWAHDATLAATTLSWEAPDGTREEVAATQTLAVAATARWLSVGCDEFPARSHGARLAVRVVLEVDGVRLERVVPIRVKAYRPMTR